MGGGRNEGSAARDRAAARLARARWAESLAAEWYRRDGFSIVAMNWRCEGGELDVVVRRGSLLVICEVKARATAAFGTPLEAMSETKQHRVRRAAMRFVREHGLGACTVRFDVASVLGTDLEIIPDAF